MWEYVVVVSWVHFGIGDPECVGFGHLLLVNERHRFDRVEYLVAGLSEVYLGCSELAQMELAFVS